MEGLINRQYVGARYVPKLMGEWDKALQYEALSIVTYKGNSFTSKIPVPSNIDINNNDYWVSTGNYNAQIENYRNETREIKTRMNTYSIEFFGCVGDGETNCTQYLKNAIDFAIKNNITLTSQGGNYLITENIDIKTAIIDMCNGTITSNNTISVGDGELSNCNINGGKVSCYKKSNLYNIKLSNFTGSGLILTNTAYETNINVIRIETTNTNTIAVEIQGSDCVINNIFGYGATVGVEVYGQHNYIENVHLWHNLNTDFNNSVLLKVHSHSNIFKNIYCDSYKTCIYNTLNKLSNYYEILWYNNSIIFKNITFTFSNAMFARGFVIFSLTGMSENNNVVSMNGCNGLNITTIDGNVSKPSYISKLTLSETEKPEFHGSIQVKNNNIIGAMSIYYNTPQSTSGSITAPLDILDINNSYFQNGFSFPVLINNTTIKNGIIENGKIKIFTPTSDLTSIVFNFIVPLNYN